MEQAPFLSASNSYGCGAELDFLAAALAVAFKCDWRGTKGGRVSLYDPPTGRQTEKERRGQVNTRLTGEGQTDRRTDGEMERERRMTGEGKKGRRAI